MEKELKSAIRFLDKVYSRDESFEHATKQTLKRLQSKKDYSSKDTVVLTRDLISDIFEAEKEWYDKEIEEEYLKNGRTFSEEYKLKIQPKIIDGTWKIIQKRCNRKNIQEVPLTVKFVRKVLADEQEAWFKDFFQEELEKKPVSANEWHHLGHAYSFIKNKKEALKCYDKVIKLKQSDALYRESEAKMLVKLRRYDEALKGYNTALKNCPPDDFWNLIDIHLGIMEVFKKTNRNQGVLREVSRVASTLGKFIKKAEPEFKYNTVCLKVGTTTYSSEMFFQAAKKAYAEGERLISVTLEPPETKKVGQSFMKKLASVIFTLKDWEMQVRRTEK